MGSDPPRRLTWSVERDGHRVRLSTDQLSGTELQNQLQRQEKKQERAAIQKQKEKQEQAAERIAALEEEQRKRP